jgi:error-prone DNA polymerase
MVMTEGRLDELVPIENAAMEDRTVIQWDKNDLEEMGLLKVDCLCLGMLTALRKGFHLIEDHHDQKFDLATVPKEDPLVYDMICKADTVGVFQIESRAQMSMLPRLKPRTWYDLVIQVAIVRPGPIQGNMVHPFLRSRNGELKPNYPNDEIRAVLERTMGVPIFQEQAMKLAVVAAGFTPGEADQLRRAMGAWRKSGTIEKFRHKLYEGMKARGLNQEFADQVFHQIRGFGEYGFPESHAASFAHLAYVSSWMKCHYPAAFCVAVLNSQPMGFYTPAQLVADAKEHGVSVLPPDVNRSDWDSTLEAAEDSLAIRLGMRLIGGLRQPYAQAIMDARRAGCFESIADFTRRTELGQATISLLSEADAFASVGQDRRAALWQALAQEKRPLDQPLFANLEVADDQANLLPELPMQEQVFEDYRTVGLSLKAHPISFHREHLDELRVTPIDQLENRRDGQHLRVAGLVTLRQRPATAKGIMFVTLEDETGSANLVVKPSIRERYYKITQRSSAWIAHGKLERRSNVTHVLINRIEDLSDTVGRLKLKSRNFR